MSSPRLALRVAIGSAAAIQIGLACAWFWPVARRIPGDIELATAASPRAPLNEALLALRALPVLLRAVPDDAPVLVVTALAAVQIEYYVLPRPMRLLQVFPREWIDLAQRHAPHIAEDVKRRRERLDDRGQVFTAERLQAALPSARFVLVAGPPPAEFAAELPRLASRGEQPGFHLFAVR